MRHYIGLLLLFLLSANLFAQTTTASKYDTIIPYTWNDSLQLVKKKGLWGINTITQNKVISPKYDVIVQKKVMGPWPEFAFTKQNEKWGIINKKGEEIAIAKYDTFFTPPRMKISLRTDMRYLYKCFSSCTRVIENQKWGVVDYLGKPIIPTIYDSISIVANFIIVQKKERFGLFNTKGDTLFPVKYKEIKIHQPYKKKDIKFKNRRYLRLIQLDDKYVMADCQGNIQNKTMYDEIIPYRWNRSLQLVKKDGLWGINNITQNEVIPTKYDTIIQPNYPRLRKNPQLAYTKQSEKWGFINEKGEEVCAAQYHSISYMHRNRTCYCTRNSALNYVKAVSSKNKWGAVNNLGELIIPTIYDSVSVVGNLTIAQQKGKLGILDAKGNELYPIQHNKIEVICINKPYCTYENIKFGSIHPLLKIQLDDKYGLISEKGNLLTEIKYDSLLVPPLRGERPHTILVQENNQWGIIDLKGQEIAPAIYDSIVRSKSERELFIVKNSKKPLKRMCFIQKNNQWGYLDVITKAVIVPPKYDEIKGFYPNNACMVVLNNQWGVINNKGELIIPIEYDKITTIEDSGFEVERNGQKQLLDWNGVPKVKDD